MAYNFGENTTAAAKRRLAVSQAQGAEQTKESNESADAIGGTVGKVVGGVIGAYASGGNPAATMEGVKRGGQVGEAGAHLVTGRAPEGMDDLMAAAKRKLAAKDDKDDKDDEMVDPETDAGLSERM